MDEEAADDKLAQLEPVSKGGRGKKLWEAFVKAALMKRLRIISFCVGVASL